MATPSSLPTEAFAKWRLDELTAAGCWIFLNIVN